MFDALVITKPEKRGLRTFASLPAAAGAHLALVTAFSFYALYAPIHITPPSAFLRFDAVPILAIPVTIVRRQSIRQDNAAVPKPQIHDAGLRAPANTPDGVKPAGQSTAPVQETDTKGFDLLPQDLLVEGEHVLEIPVPKPVVVQEYQLARAIQVVSEVQPEYPAALRAMGLAGRAVVKVIIGSTGQVEEAEMVSATHPLFGESALAAVRQWRFTRSVDCAGGPVRVIKFVTVNFTLR